jgi:site-specific DNA recombinase
MKAAAYCRVSSLEQIEGTSLQSQEEQIRAYLTMKNIELAGLFIDAGVSGGKPIAGRPEGSKLVEMVDSGEVQCVAIVKLDRAFRNVVDCLQTVDAWERAGVALHIVDLGGNSIDTTSPAGRFMLTVLSAAGEMERGMIRDRCNSGRASRKAQGFRIGEVPFGFQLGPDGKSLVISGEEQEVIGIVEKLAGQGYSASAIADDLNRRGLPTKKGGTWSHKQIIRILKRAA